MNPDTCTETTGRVLTAGKISLEYATSQLTVGGKLIHLTPHEYALLELLLRKKNSVVSKDEILGRVYAGKKKETVLGNLKTLVCKLKKKLGSDHYIETVRGSGYMLSDPDHSALRVVHTTG